MSNQIELWASQLHGSNTPSELIKKYKKISIGYKISALGAFLASLFFVAGVWLGGSWEISSWNWMNWASFGIAFLIVGGITAGQYVAYDSGIRSKLMMAAKITVILFAVLSEVFQTMEREAETVRDRSEDSGVYQATLESIKKVTADVTTIPLSGEIAANAKKLARCKDQESRGEVSHCKGDSAELAAYQTLSDKAVEKGKSVISTLVQEAKGLQFDENQHFQGIRFLKQTLGVSATAASFLFATLIIGTFEFMFYLLGVMRGACGAALKKYGLTTGGNLITDEFKLFNIQMPNGQAGGAV